MVRGKRGKILIGAYTAARVEGEDLRFLHRGHPESGILIVKGQMLVGAYGAEHHEILFIKIQPVGVQMETALLVGCGKVAFGKGRQIRHPGVRDRKRGQSRQVLYAPDGRDPRSVHIDIAQALDGEYRGGVRKLRTL